MSYVQTIAGPRKVRTSVQGPYVMLGGARIPVTALNRRPAKRSQRGGGSAPRHQGQEWLNRQGRAHAAEMAAAAGISVQQLILQGWVQGPNEQHILSNEAMAIIAEEFIDSEHRYTETLSHDGYDEDGPEREIHDFYVHVTAGNAPQGPGYYNYHHERWIGDPYVAYQADMTFSVDRPEWWPEWL